MKQLFFTTVICIIFIAIPRINTFAQKQSRVEKLYEHIAKNEREKYDKARVKIDPKSVETYKNELTLGDAFYKLFYTPDMEAIEFYLKGNMETAQKDGRACAISMCKEIGLTLENFTLKADSVIHRVLVDSKQQLEDSRTILRMLTQYNYSILPNIHTSIIVIKEKVQLEDLKAAPNKEKCETYIADFNNQYKYNDVAKIYNNLLYQEVSSKKDETSVLAFFDNPTLKTFYTNTKEERAYFTDVQKIYDTYLFGEIQKAQKPEVLKERIKTYQNTTYLAGITKAYTAAVEYKNDSIDYVILVQQVDSSSKLPLVKKYLQEHKYKEFLDKAQRLRERYVASAIWSNPTTMKFYSGNKISKESKISGDTITTIVYNYNEHGFLLDIIKNMEVKNIAPVVIRTNFKYNELGKFYEEETIDTISKTILYQANYQYDAKGNISIKNAKWSDNRSRMENYNTNGQIVLIQEYENGQIHAQTDFTYAANGQRTQRVWANMRPNINNPITKQITTFTYNDYGFLTDISYVKETLQNEKISGNIKVVYDEFANEIDANYKYEYNQTGTWINRVSKLNPADTEKIEYTYK